MPINLTHDEYLSVITRSRITGQPLDLADLLTDEAKLLIAGRIVGEQEPDIAVKRADVARFDAIKDELANVGRDDEVGLV